MMKVVVHLNRKPKGGSKFLPRTFILSINTSQEEYEQQIKYRIGPQVDQGQWK